jgi:hypothetical protein
MRVGDGTHAKNKRAVPGNLHVGPLQSLSLTGRVEEGVVGPRIPVRDSGLKL